MYTYTYVSNMHFERFSQTYTRTQTDARSHSNSCVIVCMYVCHAFAVYAQAMRASETT